MTAQLAPLPVFRGFDNNGFPAAFGTLGTFIAGTNTPQATYVDSTLTTQNTNPVVLNFRGEANVWLDPSKAYKFALKDVFGILLWTVDNITIGNANPSYSIIPTVDNLFNLGSATFSFANLFAKTNVFVGPNLVPIFDSVSGNIGYSVRTGAEIAIGVTPVSFFYPPGHVYRYGTNTVPNTTDMTAVINIAANVCRAGNYLLQVPQESKLRVTNSLDFSACHVVGLGSPFGDNIGGGIQASNAQFDVIISTGLMIIENLWVDGGWDGVTAGLTGDILSLKAVSPAHPYLVTLSNCNFQNAKKRGIYIERGGYTGMFHMHVVQCGLHALECFGLNTDACTSIGDYGRSQFGGTPFGYGIKLTECAAMIFQGTIIEATCGISLNGVDNRTIVFDGIYEEFNPTPSFTAKIDNGSGGVGTLLTVTGPASLAGLGVGSVISGAGVAGSTIIVSVNSGDGGVGVYVVNNAQLVASEAMTATPLLFVDNGAGIGLSIKGMFGANLTFPFAPGVASFHNWIGVYFAGNSNLVQGPIPLAGRIQTNSAGQNTVTVTSDVTAGQISLTPGTYRLSGTVQTVVSAGGGTLTLLACTVTTNSAGSGLNNSTSTLVEGSAQTSSMGPNQDARVNCFTELQVFVTTIYYLRVHLTLSGTVTIAYNGQLRAELIE